MTEKQAKAKLVSWCEAQLGYHEGANNYNKYADSKDLQKWYGWQPQFQPWCDIFTDSAYLSCFGLDKASKMTYQPIGGGTALCSASANAYKSNKAWFTSPEVGDQAFFFSGGGINHTGIVVAVSGNVVTTIEGNSSDAVKRNSYAVTDMYIAGFGRPKWSVVSSATDDSVPKDNTPTDSTPDDKPKKTTQYHSYTYRVSLNLLKQGDYGPLVKTVQVLLKNKGYDVNTDGDFTAKTTAAVKAFQKKSKIDVDGDVGSQTYGKLFKT